jgi:hypothetical protein
MRSPSDADVAAAIGRSYVFGDEAGLKIENFKRSRETAVLKAHGHKPVWTKGSKLAAESRAALQAIDLHFTICDTRAAAGRLNPDGRFSMHSTCSGTHTCRTRRPI